MFQQKFGELQTDYNQLLEKSIDYERELEQNKVKIEMLEMDIESLQTGGLPAKKRSTVEQLREENEFLQSKLALKQEELA